jgi:hypothetical protein
MLDNALSDKSLTFLGVLMDSWHVERKLMLHIERLHKVYYVPLKDNRQVDETGGERGYQRVDSLTESCQCRLARIQRNHIACAILVWVRLKQLAHEAASTIYHLKLTCVLNCVRPLFKCNLLKSWHLAFCVLHNQDAHIQRVYP